jgi:hypothetical protein
MGVGNLRVINEDRIAPGTGFGTHGHRDMEIVSYVLDGALAHKDSMGNGRPAAPTRASSARRRAAHERRHRRAAQRVQPRQPASTTHFLQIWILPRQRGIAPGLRAEALRRRRASAAAAPGGLADGRDGSVTIHADASLRAGLFGADRVHACSHGHLSRLLGGAARNADGSAADVLQEHRGGRRPARAGSPWRRWLERGRKAPGLMLSRSEAGSENGLPGR